MSNKNNKALIVGTITYAIGTFGTKILSFLIVPLYTYFIAPEDLGDYDLLVTTVSLLSPLLTMKISEATYRWIINNNNNERPYIIATYKLLFRNCIIVGALIAVINHFFPIWNCYYFIAILICDRILECLQKLLRGLKNQKLFAVSGVFHTALFVSLNLYKIVYLKQGVNALLQSNIISVTLTILLIFIFEPRLRYFNFKGDYRDKQKEMLRYSTPLVPSALGWWVMNASDRYVIRLMIGRAANGIYSVAYKFPSILSTVFNMFNNSWTDMALAELEKGEKTEEYTKRIFCSLYKLSFGMAFILIPASKLVMKVILSESYKEAAVYVGFLYLGTVFQSFSTFSGTGYLHSKRTAGAAKTSVIGAAINIIIDILLIRYLGLFAASISTFVGFFVMWIIRVRDLKDVFPIHVDTREFCIYMCVAITVAIAIIWTNNYLDLALTIIGAIFFIKSNKKYVSNMIKKFK